MIRGIEKKINERVRPRIWQWDYLVLKPLLVELMGFSELVEKQVLRNIIDLGCGVKPYEELFPFVDKMVGFDIEKNDRVDFVGVNWDLPFNDNEFDALISTQVLEHTRKIPETIKEIKRVVKGGGLIFISVPFVFPEHGAPYDYYRFTKYGLIEIFSDFEIISLKESSGFISTILRSINVFFNFFPGSKYYLFPIYFINNIFGIIVDKFIYYISKFGPKKVADAYQNFYMGFPENYFIILRNSNK
jgi:SAM-dependent methyltransferase